MRVLHILHELKPSGAEVMYHAAAQLWQAEGIQCEILSTGQNIGVMAPVLRNDGYAIHQIPFSRSLGHIFAVYEFLRQNRFDVVHIDTEEANFWYGMAAYLAGTRRLFRGVLNIYPFRRLLRFRRTLQRWALRRIGVTTIAISESVCRTEREHFYNPTVIIPCWFDDQKYIPPRPEQREDARRRFGLSRDVLVVASIAGCWPYKNHSAILRALASLSKEVNVLYFHVGMESADHLERKLARELGVSEKVIFHGVVDDILPVLYASDAYIMPSLHEGFGCAAVEAMGTGLPAILSRVPGLRDFETVCTEIYWTDTTQESIASGILWFLTMPEKQRVDIGMRTAAEVHRHFGLQVGAKKYAELYKNNYV